MSMRMPRVQCANHLRFIRQLFCVVCKNNTSVEAAHVRFSDASVGRVNPGSHKSSDWWVVPLCSYCHRLAPAAQHNMNEGDFWRIKGIDVSRVAMALFLHSGDQERCEHILERARNR